jgi:hypothetical protein
MNTEILEKENFSNKEFDNKTKEFEDDAEFLRMINFITLRRKMLIGE